MILVMKPGMSMPTGQPGTQAASGHMRQRSHSLSASSRTVAECNLVEVLHPFRPVPACGMGVRSWGMVRIVFFFAITTLRPILASGEPLPSP